MRIIKFDRYGAPDVLQYRKVGAHVPADNEVLIRVKAIGLNRAESKWRQGVHVEPVNLPARLGYESAGIIRAIGTIPSFSLNDYGMYGEKVPAPAQPVVKHLSTLPFEEAVSIRNPYITR
jgi:NADPH:quinone reductase-like Zn-dependent oxidoreductase